MVFFKRDHQEVSGSHERDPVATPSTDEAIRTAGLRRRQLAEEAGIEFDTETGEPISPKNPVDAGVITPDKSREISATAVHQAQEIAKTTEQAGIAAEEVGRLAVAGQATEEMPAVDIQHRLHE